MSVCDCESCSLYSANEFITRPTVTTTPAKAIRNGHSRSNAQTAGVNAALRDSSMLARAAIIGRVTRERNEARRNSHYIPPPPTEKKKEVDLDLSKRCFLPCHRGSWLMMVAACILMALGAGMCNFAFHANTYATKEYVVANETITEKNNVMYRGLRSLTYIGPCVIGIGAFLVIVACVVLFDTREKKLKEDAAQQAKIQQEINKDLAFKAMLDKKPKGRRDTTVVDMPANEEELSIEESHTDQLEKCLTSKPLDRSKLHVPCVSRHATAAYGNIHSHRYLGKTMSAPLMPIQAASTTESTSSNKYDSISITSQSSAYSSKSDHHSEKADSISSTGLQLNQLVSTTTGESEPKLSTYFTDKGEKNAAYEYSDYSLKTSAIAASLSSSSQPPSNNNNTFVDVDRDIKIEQAVVRPRTLRTDSSCSRSNEIPLHSPGDNDVEPLCPPLSTELTTSL